MQALDGSPYTGFHTLDLFLVKLLLVFQALSYVIQPHQNPGQHLGGLIMDLSGNSLPFFLLGTDELEQEVGPNSLFLLKLVVQAGIFQCGTHLLTYRS